MANRKKKKSRIGCISTVIVAIASFVAGKSLPEWDATQMFIEDAGKQADITRLEIPQTEKEGQIIQRTGYTLFYDNRNKTPHWVAWELTKEETRGNVERTNRFEADPDVIGSKVEYRDYTGSGYDRGHMAPAGDMKWSKKAMEESFYMSNICPQDHDLNTNDWNDLENKCREWARRYGKVYIVCGPIYTGERNEYIGTRRVKVPDAFFKAVLVHTDRKQCALGFIFENEAGERPLEKYLVPVDKIEKVTGLDLFAALPDDLECKLEAETLNRLP